MVHLLISPNDDCTSEVIDTIIDTVVGVGNNGVSGLRKTYTRTTFKDVGEAIRDMTDLQDIISCLQNARQGMFFLAHEKSALEYMHKVGWMHRDFSVGNATNEIS